jgi:hypothetical protein
LPRQRRAIQPSLFRKYYQRGFTEPATGRDPNDAVNSGITSPDDSGAANHGTDAERGAARLADLVVNRGDREVADCGGPLDPGMIHPGSTAQRGRK